MENSHAPDESRPLDDPRLTRPDRWVPCLYDEDEYCLHIACQVFEPLEDRDVTDVNDD